MDIIKDPGLALYLPLFKPDGTSLVSEDARGQGCMVTGALWTPRGRFFDGVDDLIAVNAVAAGDFFGGAHTIIVWAKLTEWTKFHCPVGAGRTDSVDYWVQFYFDKNTGFMHGATCSQAGGTNDVTCNIDLRENPDFHFYALVVDADGHIDHFIVNDTDCGGADTYNNDLSSIDKLYVGQIPYTSANTNPWKGTIGDVFVFNRGLTVGEVAFIKQSTGWRYR